MKEILEELAKGIQNPHNYNEIYEYMEVESVPDAYLNTEGILSYLVIRKYPKPRIIFKEDLYIQHPVDIEKAREQLRKRMLQSLTNYAVLSSLHFIEEYDKTRSS